VTRASRRLLRRLPTRALSRRLGNPPDWFRSLAAQWQVRAGLGLGLSLSNAIGIAVVYLLSTLVIPMPEADRDFLLELSNILLAAAYVVVFGTVGTFQAWRVLHPVVVMLRPGDEPSDQDRRDVLAAPRRIFLFQGFLWGVASILILLQFSRYSFTLALSIFLVVALAGWTTTSLTYLLSERALRPVARRVLQGGFPERMWVRSVASRTMFAWALGTGATVLGIVFTGAIALIDQRATTVSQLSVTVVVLGGIVLLVGGMSSLVAAQASSEPIASLRDAVARVEEGDLDVEVPIYDSTEIGLLQSGFNRMVQGLREREEMRDIFGRHVGTDVARAALEDGAKLGGEVREVAVLFVDIVGSTGLAENEDPEEVVGLLNRFFEVVIDVVHEHGGWINKFAGDAALAIWGAPSGQDDHCAAALRAARVLTTRLGEDVPELRAGVGVSCGRVLAGNVGAAERFEYTVIGDPVNEAARLTEEAKKVPSLVVANHQLVLDAGDDEARHWCELDPLQLRGRSQQTRVATVRGDPRADENDATAD
jgi:adenylate cyclase